MKRPFLNNLNIIQTDDHLAIKASVSLKDTVTVANSFIPIQAYQRLFSDSFSIKIIGKSSSHEILYQKVFETDHFGILDLKIPLNSEKSEIQFLELFETKYSPGLELNMGSYLPTKILGFKKIIICDFDKTLIDTRYSTPKEIFQSLTLPLIEFPKVEKSLLKLNQYLTDDFYPFILSASPHFYEDAIRNWLAQNDIFKAGIFLKDYRKIFSLFETSLTTKDIALQGLYKMGHLLDILLMIGIPDKLVLMGDNFESDPIIYSLLTRILTKNDSPRDIWNKIKKLDIFRLNTKQNSIFLEKIYHLKAMKSDFEKRGKSINIEIYIRKKANESHIQLPALLENQTHFLNLY